ncbi:Germin [Parasponia andersonii]|uniref:Germin-like protein n=1 Tax=Parasponia andersonii TaxID=3476 RepID=A0A2P5BNC5_PARAD|nr:Germin [Parasponia andersonii]
MASYVVLLVIQGLFWSIALAADQSLLQDFCVSDPRSQELPSGLACKDPNQVRPEDFFFSGLNVAGEITNPVGSRVTPVTSAQVPGLNSLGISLARIDYAPWGINPPHTHPRASEILTVLEGTLEIGFITSNPDNRQITKVLQKGDAFVFPVGLIHYQRNVGSTSAAALAAFSSQNPGVVSIAKAVFGAAPDIASDILVKSFQVDNSVINFMQSKFKIN